MKKQLEKDIAERTGVSVSKIDRVLNNISSHTVLRHENLPKQMNWDEFKATKNTKGKMALLLLITNQETFLILMILEEALI
jgi:transposase